MKTILLPFVLGELCLLIFYASSYPWPGDGVTFCVTPYYEYIRTNCRLNHECHNALDCLPLNVYWGNINSIINQQQLRNVTLYFLNGNHTGNCLAPVGPSKQSLAVPYVRMIGESEDVQIMCLFVEFQSVIDIKIQLMEIKNGAITIKPLVKPYNPFIEQAQISIISVKAQLVDIGLRSISGYTTVIIKHSSISTNLLSIRGPPVPTSNTSTLLSECTLYDGMLDFWSVANVTIESCNLTNYKIFSINSNILFTGVSQIAASNQNSSAILSVSSTIIILGNMLFIDNIAPKGAAMALYSSHLKLLGGTYVSFINNTAHEVGGAIYIDPGYLAQGLFLLKAGIGMSCFYQTLACEHTTGVTFNFANNSATNGGDDIYGACITSSQCEPSEDGQCAPYLNASVSSDPTRVCLCNNNEPQCMQQSANYQVHSGESFPVEVVVVGGDFSPTIGTIFANFLTSSRFSLPSVLDGKNHVIRKKHCTELNYTLYSNYTQNSFMMYLTTMHTDIDNNLGCDLKFDPYCSLTTPVYLNISLLQCLRELTVQGKPPKCDCYPALKADGIQCRIINGTGISHGHIASG